MRRLPPALAMLVAALVLAAPAGAQGQTRIVGGTAAGAGMYPSIAHIVVAATSQCTGTLVAPTWVLTAAHCATPIVGGPGLPVGLPGAAFDVSIGGTATDGSDGEPVTVMRAAVPPEYLLTLGHDVALLELLEAPASAPVPVAGLGYGPLWAPNAVTEIVGFGTTSSGGAGAPSLQRAGVPLLPDASCQAAYPDSFEATTQLCAGFAAGGVDACQGDSGGPAYGRTSADEMLVVATSSYGDGCAAAGRPGVYARAADTELREWIRGLAPDAVRDAAAGAVTAPMTVYDPVTQTMSPGAPVPPSAPPATEPGTPGPSSAPGPAPGTAGEPAGASDPAPAAPASATVPATASTRALRIALGVDPVMRRTLARRGLRYRLRCSGPCVADVLLRIDVATARRLRLRSTVVGRSRLTRDSGGRSLQQIRISSPRLRSRLVGLRGMTLTLEASVGPRGTSERAMVAKRVRLK